MAWISQDFGSEVESDPLFQKVSIQHLSSELSQVVMLGIVIAKQDVRGVISRKQPGSERYVFNFTLRDSPNDTINAMCWGDETNVKTLSSSFMIGDVIKIKNPQIIERQTEVQDDKFRPRVTSHYLLNLSPLYSVITVCDGEESNEFQKLIHCAMINTSDLLCLADVIYNSQNVEGMNLNLLVGIKDIKSPQNMKTKSGKEITKLLISVFDQTHNMFPIVIWDNETANFILKYCARRSILLITDIKIGYNAYMKELVATAGSATIFTPEPDIPERRVLYQYAVKLAIPNEYNEIKTWDTSKLYTLNQIHKAMNTSELEADEIEGTVNTVLTMFDIDGLAKIYSLRCPGCYQMFQNQDDKCTNGVCEIGCGIKFSPPEEIYDIVISLTDETASIDRCLLRGQVAENLLGLNVKQYKALSDDEKTVMKWKFLFERFLVHFKVSQPTTGNGKLHLRVMKIERES